MSRASTTCLALAVVPALYGCATGDCAGLADTRALPNEVTIAVGQTVTVQYQEAGYCFGGAPTENDYRPVATHWTTADSLIITVDSLTGTITGRAVGEARVSPTNAPALSVAIHVR